MAMQDVQVEVGHHVESQRALYLLKIIRESEFIEHLSEADRVKVAELGLKRHADLVHADVAWLSGKIAEVCAVEHPRFVTRRIDDGVNPNAIQPAAGAR